MNEAPGELFGEDEMETEMERQREEEAKDNYINEKNDEKAMNLEKEGEYDEESMVEDDAVKDEDNALGETALEDNALEDNALEEDINVTDSQVMIQLKEAEEEGQQLRKEIAKLKKEIDDYQCREALSESDEEHLQEIQLLLMEKIALLDELTKRIAKLMEFAGKGSLGEETTILEDEEEEGFPDDLLPRVVICSSWDDMMPKVVVCMDMKKPSAVKKGDLERDENGLTPEQREALEQERRCMAEERNRLQYQVACMEGEMRVMMRENDMLSKKVAQLKAEMENQPPFEFEMSVSATQPPGVGCPKTGNMEMGYGVMGPNANGNYTMGAALSPGADVRGKLAISGPPPQLPPPYLQLGGACCQRNSQSSPHKGGQPAGQLPCGGVTGIPGKTVPCPTLQPQEAPGINPNDWTTMIPPYGKKCRKDFNALQGGSGGCAGGGCSGGTCGGGACGGVGCDSCPGCNQLPGGCCGVGVGGGCGVGVGGGCGGSCGVAGNVLGRGIPQTLLPPGLMKPNPMDVNFKVNVQPQSLPCNKAATEATDDRSNRIAQQLQEIELELRRMQRDLCKAKKDKDTLKAQQATLNCTKNFLM